MENALTRYYWSFSKVKKQQKKTDTKKKKSQKYPHKPQLPNESVWMN
jgi:hypothetical protein